MHEQNINPGNNFDLGELIAATNVIEAKHNLPIGSFIIFINDQATKISIPENDMEINALNQTNGQWHICSDKNLLATLNRQSPLYLQIMQEPWPKSLAYKKVLTLALAMTITRGITTAEQFITNEYLSMYDAVEPGTLAASNLIFTLQNFLIYVPSSFYLALNILASRYTQQGAEGKQKVATSFQSTYVLAVLEMLIILPIMYWSEFLLKLIGQDPAVAKITQDFFRAYMCGVPAVLFNVVDRQISFAIQDTLPLLFVTACGVICSGILGYGFTNGRLGFDAMGAKGEAYALAISAWLTFILYKAYILFSKKLTDYSLLKWRGEHRNELSNIMDEGFPIAVQITIELASLLGFSLLVGGLFDPNNSAALQISFIYVYLGTTVIFAISQAATVLVAKADELQLPQTLKRLANASTNVALTFGVLYFVALATQTKGLTNLFLTNLTAATDIQSITQYILPILGAALIFDAVRNTAMGALRASGDTWYLAGISCASLLALFLPVSFAVGKHFDVTGMSIVFTACIALATLAIMPRYFNFINSPAEFKAEKAEKAETAQKFENIKQNIYRFFSRGSAAGLPVYEPLIHPNYESINATSTAQATLSH